jgi:1-phosphofructokinase/tagatose 6-phosphate kinase
VNTIGSGDAFTAGLSAALDDGLPFAGAVARGVRYGGLNAALLKPGVIRDDTAPVP